MPQPFRVLGLHDVHAPLGCDGKSSKRGRELGAYAPRHATQ